MAKRSLVASAAVVAGAATLSIIGVPSAFASVETPGAAGGVARVEADAGDPSRTTVSHDALLWFLESELVDLQCPDSHPYLINERLAARAVPYGVSVDEDPAGGMFVTATASERDGYQSGVRDMLITNLDFTNLLGNRWAKVTLHCTADTSEAQPW